jgi:hypothetical protein
MDQVRMRRTALMMILLTAACATDSGEPSDVRADSPSPVAPMSPTASSAAVDPGAQACRQIKKIVDDGYKITIKRLYEVGETGAKSADSEVSLNARLLRDFAAVAATRIQAGGDPAQEAEALRGAIKDLVDACAAGSYI